MGMEFGLDRAVKHISGKHVFSLSLSGALYLLPFQAKGGVLT